MSRREHAATAVELIIEDLSGRGGLDNVWEEIDNVTRQEIMDTWQGIIARAILAEITDMRNTRVLLQKDAG